MLEASAFNETEIEEQILSTNEKVRSLALELKKAVGVVRQKKRVILSDMHDSHMNETYGEPMYWSQYVPYTSRLLDNSTIIFRSRIHNRTKLQEANASWESYAAAEDLTKLNVTDSQRDQMSTDL